MTWFKVDDKLHDHRKARAAGTQAMGVWLLAGSWSADNLTDGFIPADVLPRWGRPRDAEKLVAVGLWHADEQDGEKGWRFHEWAERQPTRAQKLAEREAKAEAGRVGGRSSGRSRREAKSKQSASGKPPEWLARGRRVAGAWQENGDSATQVSQPEASRKPAESDSTQETGATREAKSKQSASGLVEPPSRPVPDPTTDAYASVSRAERSESDVPDRFDEFWNVYDHKVGRKKAQSAWRSALKKPGVTPDLLIAAAAEYVAWVKSEGKHPQYTKHPATWLNGEHWNDERAARHPPQTNTQRHLALAHQLANEQPPDESRQIGTGR